MAKDIEELEEAVAVTAELKVEKTPKTYKAKVVRSFKDKYTGVVYGVGETIEVTTKRLKEINSEKTFVEKI